MSRLTVLEVKSNPTNDTLLSKDEYTSAYSVSSVRDRPVAEEFTIVRSEFVTLIPVLAKVTF